MDVIDLDVEPTEPAPVMSRRTVLGGGLLTLAAVGLVRVSRPNTAGTDTADADATAATRVWGSFAGSVPATRAYLLVAVDTAGAVLGHVCDGTATAAWFDGRVTGGAIGLASGAFGLDATIESDRLTGGLSVRGIEYPFVLARVRHRGGLYAASTTVGGVEHIASWIMLDDGTQRGALRIGDMTVPAPELCPTRSGLTTASGVRLQPVRLDRLSVKWGRFTRTAG